MATQIIVIYNLKTMNHLKLPLSNRELDSLEAYKKLSAEEKLIIQATILKVEGLSTEQKLVDLQVVQNLLEETGYPEIIVGCYLAKAFGGAKFDEL